MPFRKRQPQVKKEAPPETTLLSRVTLPGAHQETSLLSLTGENDPAPPMEAGRLIRVPLDDIPSEPAPRALRRSFFEQTKRQPGNPNPWILLGWSSADARSAATYFQRALNIDPENPVARDGLDWALSEIGPAIKPPAEQPALPIAEAELVNQTSSVEIPGWVGPEQPGGEPAAQLEDAALSIQGTGALPSGSHPRIRDFRWRTISRFYQIPFFRNLSIAIFYLLLISGAEVVTVLVNPTIGIIFHALVMIGLIIQGSILQQGPFRRYLIMLSLAPLIRILSLSLPLAVFDFPIMYRYMIVGLPILLAAFFAARSVGLTANRLYFSWKGWPFQLLFSLTGFLLGYAEYYILHPQVLVPTTGWFDIAMGVFILIVFTGFLEEFIFRSLLQVTGIQLFGGIAIWLISILFGILHIGYYSAFDVLFAASVGLFFGYFALKTRSLLGISLAHGITNITLYIILPLVLR